MNLSTLSTAVTVARAGFDKLAKYREEKARDAYTALETAAKNVGNATQDWFPESRKQAGYVTQAAHARLERALADFNARRQDFTATAAANLADATDSVKESVDATRKDAAKSAAKTSKQLRRSTKQARKDAIKTREQALKKAAKARKTGAKKCAKLTGKKQKKSVKFWPIAAVVALISAVLGGVYYVLRRNDKPSEVPPRVEEFSHGAEKAAEGSTLVYTSTTEHGSHPVHASRSDLAEEGVTERDEELLGSIDEQLAKHREEELAEAELAKAEVDDSEFIEDPEPGADTSRITDDRPDEGKHRLAEESK